MKDELALVKGLLERFEEEPPEKHGQDRSRQEVSGAAGYPALAVRRQSASRYEAVQMGVVPEGLSPRMEDRHEP